MSESIFLILCMARRKSGKSRSLNLVKVLLMHNVTSQVFRNACSKRAMETETRGSRRRPSFSPRSIFEAGGAVGSFILCAFLSSPTDRPTDVRLPVLDPSHSRRRRPCNFTVHTRSFLSARDSSRIELTRINSSDSMTQVTFPDSFTTTI